MFSGLIDSQRLKGNSWKTKKEIPAVIDVAQFFLFYNWCSPGGTLITLSLNLEIFRHNRGEHLPFPFKAVGNTSLLIEPQGKKSGGIFVSSPMKTKTIKYKVVLVSVEMVKVPLN